MNLTEMFKTIKTILVIDWPNREVPETLARAGFYVVVRGGTGPEDFSAFECKDGEVVTRRIGRPPERVDLVYSYRPISELPDIIATAKSLYAKTLWTQSGLSTTGEKDPRGCWLRTDDLQLARNLVHSAGLNYVTEPYIADVAREIQALHAPQSTSRT